MVDLMATNSGKLVKRNRPPARPVAARSGVASQDELSTLDERIAQIVATGYGVPVVWVEQAEHHFVSTHRSGIATCTLGNRERRSVFWKMGPACRGDWGGLPFACVGYEIGAYASIRKVADMPAPVLIGGEIRESDALLVTEYAGSMCRINKFYPAGSAMGRAAYRIGTFHRRASVATSDSRLACYNRKMFGFWASRASGMLPNLPWLARVSVAFPSFVAALQATSSTVIHGEYYPRNVLASTDEIMAVDWEWSGTGMGEIDLAALTENWDESTVAACMAAYAESRRINIADKLFRKRLTASRLYLHLRNLVLKARHPRNKETLWRLNNVHAHATELGIL